MDDVKIREAIDVIDREVPKDGARVQFTQYGGGPDESKIVANQAGYLRLGVELLKAAYSPVGYKSDPDTVSVDLEYLTVDSDINFSWFERREPTEFVHGKAPRAIVAAVMGVIGVFLICSIVGFVVVLRWLFS